MVAGKGRPGLDTDSAETQPSLRAWVAAGAIDAQGTRCDRPEEGALTIVAVSVHEMCAPRSKSASR